MIRLKNVLFAVLVGTFLKLVLFRSMSFKRICYFIFRMALEMASKFTKFLSTKLNFK